MKHVHYVMKVSQLTGDSSITFFPTMQDAIQAYDEQVNPLLDILINEGIISDRDDATYNDCFYFVDRPNNIIDFKGIRFYGCMSHGLDKIIKECDTYFEYRSIAIDDNANKYCAYFNEGVDNSRVVFYSSHDDEFIYDLMEYIREVATFVNHQVYLFDGIESIIDESFLGLRENYQFTSHDNEDKETIIFQVNKKDTRIDYYMGGEVSETIRLDEISTIDERDTTETIHFIERNNGELSIRHSVLEKFSPSVDAFLKSANGTDEHHIMILNHKEYLSLIQDYQDTYQQ